jgi:gliding motility-associated-like protein
MKRSSFILISVLIIFSFKAGAQCVSVRSNTTICQGTTLSTLGGSMLHGTNSIEWSDNGAGGAFSPDKGTLNASWTPAVTYSGTATLTLVSTAGCTSLIKTASFTVNVTPLPAATISYSGTPFCKSLSTAQHVTRTGTSGGRYSSTAGLTINATSGAITPATSTAGTYTVTYTIAAAGGCGIVTATTNAVITAVPAAPVTGSVTQPSCTYNTGSVALSGLPANGNWVLTCNPGGSTLPGSGTTTTFSGLASGSYTFTVTTVNNCTSVSSGSAVINAQPPTPSAPVVGTITPSKCSDAIGRVQLSGLPASGTWTITRTPGGIITTGSGTGITITLLAAGTYTFTVANSYGCISQPSVNVIIINQPAPPSAPVIGTVSQPTCSISTGSVGLSGLPGSGTWTISRSPDGLLITGTGTTTTISTLPSGSYTFTVINSGGCSSIPSAGVLINPQPLIPPAPSIGTITPPTCSLPTGSVLLSGLPSSGTWTLIRYPGTLSSTGTGTSTTITGLLPGTYNFTVTTKDGCLSVPSSNVVIPVQPVVPDTPVVGTITQPTVTVPTGSVILNGLPATGTWVIIRSPGGVTYTGIGLSHTISGLNDGVYTFTVTNASGCISKASSGVIISIESPPVLIITNPPSVCSPDLVDITGSSITAGSSPGLTYTYWTDTEATIPFNSPKAANSGIYYVKGTTSSGSYNIKPVTVTVNILPVAYAGIDQTLDYKFSTTLDATIEVNETGIWSMISGSASFADNTNPKTQVTNLALGENLLVWTVKKGTCPSVSDTLMIVINNLVIPTLITPNMDGKNDYFVLKDLEIMGKTELYIFDRRGVGVYKNLNYDNKWNGVDYNNKPLPEDTYFYIIISQAGRALKGYIVIRK